MVIKKTFTPSDFICDGAAHESTETSTDEENGNDEGPEEIQRRLFHDCSVCDENALVAEFGDDLSFIKSNFK